METSATGRAIVERLKLLEAILQHLEAADGSTVAEWRRCAKEARQSKPRSEQRREFRLRCRAAKAKWLPLRDLILKNRRVLMSMEREVVGTTIYVPHMDRPKCGGRQTRGTPYTPVTLLDACWVLCDECVGPAKDVILQVLERLQELAPMRAIMAAIHAATPQESLNPKLFNRDGSLKETPHRILKALEDRNH